MGKHHKHHPQHAVKLAPDELERRARQELENRRWRQARDLFKELCKQDRPKYLPDLIRANEGLAASLMEKGQIAEAQQVVEHLRTLAPEGHFSGLELRRAVSAHDWKTAARLAAELWEQRGDSLTGEERRLAADALVLGFPDPDGADMPAAGPLSTEPAAVLRALQCVSEARYEQAQELLRPLPRASLFAEWKTFIKGLIAFHTGDREKARQLFDLISEECAPARSAEPFKAMLQPQELRNPDLPNRNRILAQIGQVFGAKELAASLPEAERLWNAGKYVGSFQLARRAPEFPTQEPGFAGELSDFYYRAPFHLQDDAEYDYFEAIYEIEESGRFKNEAEACYVHRIVALDELGDTDKAPEDEWKAYLAHFKSHPQRKKIESLAWHAVAKPQAEPEERGPFPWLSSRKPKAKDARTAERLLKRSIDANPSNLAPYLTLADLYETLKNASARNRLLDEMTERFPNEKAVLLRAGRGCIDRKAFTKGLQYLTRARELDPLDPAVLNALIDAALKTAIQHYQKKAPEKAREACAVLDEYAVKDRLDLDRGLDILRARQGVLEHLFGDPERAKALFDEAYKVSRSQPALWMSAHAYFRSFRQSRNKLNPLWQRVLASPPRTRSERADLVKAFAKACDEIEERLLWQIEADWIIDRLFESARTDMEPGEIEALAGLFKRVVYLDHLPRELTKEVLERHPKDVRLRLRDIENEEKAPVHRIPELKEIRDRALAEGDQHAVHTAERLLRSLEMAGDPINPFGFDDAEADNADGDFDGPDAFDPEMLDQMEEMRRKVAKMSDEEYAAFRKMVSGQFPPEMLDALMGRKVRSTPAKPKGKPKNPFSSDEPELF